MKKTAIICICAILILVFVGVALNLNGGNEYKNSDYLRIHIRANSNTQQDQDVKYIIKDSFVEFLTPKIAFCTTKQQVVEMIINNRQQLQNLANSVLKQNGFNYTANVKIDAEVFPTRTYQGHTLQSGVYDAIIVELGSATGNNWWCVVYPPLCFVNAADSSFENIVYKSKLWEIIKQFFN